MLCEREISVWSMEISAPQESVHKTIFADGLDVSWKLSIAGNLLTSHRPFWGIRANEFPSAGNLTTAYPNKNSKRAFPFPSSPARFLFFPLPSLPTTQRPLYGGYSFRSNHTASLALIWRTAPLLYFFFKSKFCQKNVTVLAFTAQRGVLLNTKRKPD